METCFPLGKVLIWFRKGESMKGTKEQQILQDFYKELFQFNTEKSVQRFVVVIMEFMLGCILLIPFQAICKEENIIWQTSIFSLWGLSAYLLPYLRYVEEKKIYKVMTKLKFVPISGRAVRIFWLRKLICFQGRFLPFFLAGQLLITWLCYHSFVWGNLWYPVLLGFVVPVCVNALMLWPYSIP